MGKVIGIWGSPNSGKTTFSIKLARELAKENSVIAVFPDIVCPVIPTIVGQMDSEKSLGNILSSAKLTQEEIFKNSVSIEKFKNLGIVGYAEYENIFSYPQYSETRAIEFINELRYLADYIIIDLSSNFTVDLLSTTSLERADKVIRLNSSSLKDLSYFNSHLPLLSDSRFKANKHINILSKFKSYDAINELNELYNIQAYFEYSEEIREQSLCNELFNSLSTKEEINLKSNLKTIMDIIEPKEKIENDKVVKKRIFNIFKRGKIDYESIG